MMQSSMPNVSCEAFDLLRRIGKRIGILVCMLVLFASGGVRAEQTAYPLDKYRDKTAACVTGHIAGLLSGFEFVSGKDGVPLAPLPAGWFSLLRGPYGGGLSFGGAGESRMLDAGIGSDDDLHIDFFNQMVMEEAGGIPTYHQIYESWLRHRVSDWGGGGKAMQLMKKKAYLPPMTGLLEYGNTFHWCTEPYIENETLGCLTPGLTQQAYALSDRFACVTGDFESLDWARFWAAAYAAAYTAPDAETVLSAASGSLLDGSWPKQIYDICTALYHSGMPWQQAVTTVEGMRRTIDGCDNIQCSADVNNGFGVLAMLYGENNWLESVRLASICGYDADCTAACVGGCMGILLGMEGLPQQVLDEVWRDGQGLYVNDLNFTPHIAKDYPETQTLQSLCNAYERNMLYLAAQFGGSADDAQVYLPQEPTVSRQGRQPENADFETGTLAAWVVFGDGASACTDEASHSGNFCAQVKSADGMSGLSRILNGLDVGAWYRVSVYVRTSFQGTARVRVVSDSDSAMQSVRSADKGWILREVYFRASTSKATVFLENASASDERIYTVCFDDLRVEKLQAISQKPLMVIEENEVIHLSGAAASGEMALFIAYENCGNTLVNGQLSCGGEEWCAVPFSPSGESAALWIPVTLDGAADLCLTELGEAVTLLSAVLSDLPKAATENDALQ